jgi:HTH-type transcriptional regulator / antitoxin HipB
MKPAMLIRTPADLGALIRGRRKELGLDQAGLAERIGVNRKWVIGIERGRARAELGIVLRALGALGIRLDAITDKPSAKSVSVPSINIDDIVTTARKGKP